MIIPPHAAVKKTKKSVQLTPALPVAVSFNDVVSPQPFVALGGGRWDIPSLKRAVDCKR